MILLKKDNLDTFLKRQGWNDSKLADALDLSQSIITRVRQNRNCSDRFQEKLVLVTGFEWDLLFYFDGGGVYNQDEMNEILERKNRRTNQERERLSEKQC